MLNSSLPLDQSVNYANRKQCIEKLRDANCTGKHPLPPPHPPSAESLVWGQGLGTAPADGTEHEEQPRMCQAHVGEQGKELLWAIAKRTCCSRTGSLPPCPGCCAWNPIKKNL